MSQTNEETPRTDGFYDEKGNWVIEVPGPTEEEKAEARKQIAPLLEFFAEGNEGTPPTVPNHDPEPPQFLEQHVPDDGSFGVRSGGGPNPGALGNKVIKLPNPAWDAWAQRNGKQAEALPEHGVIQTPHEAPGQVIMSTNTGASPFAVAMEIEKILPKGASMKVGGRQIIISM